MDLAPTVELLLREFSNVVQVLGKLIVVTVTVGDGHCCYCWPSVGGPCRSRNSQERRRSANMAEKNQRDGRPAAPRRRFFERFRAIFRGLSLDFKALSYFTRTSEPSVGLIVVQLSWCC